MKKLIFAGFGAAFIGLIAYAAATTSSVDSVVLKSTISTATDEQKKATAEDFNAIVDTIKGIENTKNGINYEIGLNAASIKNVDLAIDSTFRATAEKLPKCFADNSGMFVFSTVNKHFWGCDGKDWKQLDVTECVAVDAACVDYGSVEQATQPAKDDATGCVAGIYSDTADDGAWNWTCSGTGGGADAQCTAVKPLSVNGVCGKTNNSCVSGTLSDIGDSTTEYLWNCVGLNGGITDSCSLLKPVSGVCDYKNEFKCVSGETSNKNENETHFLWDCVGYNGGSTSSCSKSKNNLAMVYACGEKGWKYLGKDIDAIECEKSGVMYDLSKDYVAKDEVCSTYIPNDKNCKF